MAADRYPFGSALMVPGTDVVDYVDRLLDRPTWHKRAVCRGDGLDDYFPERGESTLAAKAVCAGCVVRSDCLAFALADSNTVGIWGGTGGT